MGGQQAQCDNLRHVNLPFAAVQQAMRKPKGLILLSGQTWHGNRFSESRQYRRSTEESIVVKQGHTVTLKPEWQDEGDAQYIWRAIEDEDGGRVRISPINTGLQIAPSYVVETSMLETTDTYPHH